ncbi:alpha/beta hydrolase-fold protein [Clostridium estertheticum]|uniref:alpha/beta hydrolase-fold protein n=1 Tax=Clostridium estertheticum TaxID=238834 RepID=UPI001CF0F8FF|nr:alpha/beta hydrolase-fold protein [Clostridium estertheticum]MCB2360921.1 alpha/beta hydrolase [Clostridium estertheticum]
MQIKQLIFDKKEVTIFKNDNVKTAVPAVYVNIFRGDGSSLWETCNQLGCPDFTMIAIGNLDWDNDLTPWTGPPIFPNDGVYAGNADEHLKRIINKIMPEVESFLPEKPLYSAISGYSLGGLFAAYAAYRTTAFQRFASMSGSFWYPNFIPFATTHELACQPDCFYLSIGDKEERTSNKIVAAVGQNTRTYLEFLKKNGILSILEMNPGNHYTDGNIRTAKGICWILNQ